MAVNKKSLKNLEKGKKFSSANQPNNRGRKPSALRFIRDEGVSITDIKRIIGSLIWEYDPTELTALLKDKNNPPPMGIALVLNALTDDQKSKGITNFDKLMDRAYGKPTQNVDLAATSVVTSVSLSPENRRSRIEELLKKSETKSQ